LVVNDSALAQPLSQDHAARVKYDFFAADCVS
jgi:hypothetical protein